MKQPQTFRFTVALAAWLALMVSPAFAHVGHGATGGFAHGFAHPLSGMDHLLAMLAVGLWAALIGGRALFLVPLAFAGTMTIAAVLAVNGIAFPLIEVTILASVIVLGLLIAADIRLPVALGMAIVALFALGHGAAHGAEMPLGAGGFAYGSGFLGATLLLHGFGMLTGLLFARPALFRLGGGAVALAGFALLFVG